MPGAVTTLSARLTTQVMNPLLASFIDNCESLLGWKLERDNLELRPANASHYDVTAQISITGQIKGTVAFSLTESTALAAATTFAGDTYTRVNDEVRDAIAELTNIIVGTAKSKLEMGLNIGLPTVVTGQDHMIHFPAESEPMRVTYSCKAGSMFVDFGFVQKKTEFSNAV